MTDDRHAVLLGLAKALLAEEGQGAAAVAPQAPEPPAGDPAPGLTPGQAYAQQQQQQAEAQQAAAVPGQPPGGALTGAQLDAMSRDEIIAYESQPGGEAEINRLLTEGL